VVPRRGKKNAGWSKEKGQREKCPLQSNRNKKQGENKQSTMKIGGKGKLQL